jgi:hypothetical protein
MTSTHPKPASCPTVGVFSRHAFEEFHIELDGDVRKTKPVSPDDHRWRSEIEEAWASRSDEPAQRT